MLVLVLLVSKAWAKGGRIGGAGAILELLRGWGFKLGIVTNGSEKGQSAKIDVLGLRGLVDAVVISEIVGVKKPDPLIFTVATEALGVAAEEVVFVGDHPQNDVMGAVAVGMQAVWLRGSCEWPAGVPRIHSIDELLQLRSYLEKKL